MYGTWVCECACVCVCLVAVLAATDAHPCKKNLPDHVLTTSVPSVHICTYIYYVCKTLYPLWLSHSTVQTFHMQHLEQCTFQTLVVNQCMRIRTCICICTVHVSVNTCMHVCVSKCVWVSYMFVCTVHVGMHCMYNI